MPCLPLVIIAVLVVTMLAPHVTGGQSEDTVPAGELSGPQGSDTIEATAGGPATGVLGPETRARHAELNRLWQQATEFRQVGRPADAIPPVERVLVIERQLFGEIHEEIALTLEALVDLHDQAGDLDAAEQVARERLRVIIGLVGARHWRATDARLAISRLAAIKDLTPQDRERINEGRQFQERAIRLYSSGRYAEAEPLFKQALEVYRATLGEVYPDYVAGVTHLARLYSATGRDAAAELLYRRALEITEAAFGEEHPDYAVILDNLSALYWATGRYAKAEPLCRRALEVRRAALGEEHPDHAQSLSNLALLYQAIG
ncbi:MAG TPA: tetratricopeptide repeat protein, partial [Planctomycetaceae bacterium]